MSNTVTMRQSCVHFPSLACINNPPLIRSSTIVTTTIPKKPSIYLRPSLRQTRKSLVFPKSVKFNTPLEQVQFFDPVQSEDEYDSEDENEDEEDILEDEFLALFSKRTQFNLS